MGDEPSLMDELASAWEASEEGETNAEVQQPEATEDENPPADPVSGREERSDDGEEPPVVQASEEPVQEEQSSEPAVEDAPAGLSAAAREVWKDTPKEVRDEISKREADYEKGIVKYAENAKRAEQMDQVLGPYQQLFAMNGGAAQMMPGLLQTASHLQMGSPIQKAQTVANLIQQFGVDVKTLDSLLVGENPPQEVQQTQQVEQLVNQRIQQYEQQRQQETQQQQVVQVQSEIEQFASDSKNEFYNDVKGDMADLLELAANRGQDLSLADAYDRACQINPQISQIIAARQNKATAAQKQQAATSIAGSPGGPGDGGQDMDLRSTIESAWAGAGRA